MARFWLDNWLSSESLDHKYPRMFQNADNLKEVIAGMGKWEDQICSSEEDIDSNGKTVSIRSIQPRAAGSSYSTESGHLGVECTTQQDSTLGTHHMILSWRRLLTAKKGCSSNIFGESKQHQR